MRCQPPANDWNLRGRLGLGNWKCERSTGPETTCSNSILIENRDNIDFLIRSMILLSQESSELASKLEELAKIAYCGSHKLKDKHDQRKAKWKSIFPVQEKDVLPFVLQIMEVFESASALCPVIKADKIPCRKNIGGWKVQEYRKKIGKIIQFLTYSKDTDIDNHLRILETNIYCVEHELTMPVKRRDSWKSKILKILAKVDLDSKSFSQCPIIDEYERQLGGFGRSSRSRALDADSHNIPTSGALLSVNVDKQTVLSELEEFDTTPFRILNRKNARGKRTLNSYIRSYVEKDLYSTELKPGYIYVLEAEKVPGFIKIGYTTQLVANRLKELRFRCNRQFKVIYPTLPNPTLVPRAKRVERLCHAELIDSQVRTDCTGCLQEHHEWFKISSENAIAVIKKWSAWMNSDPYDSALGNLKDREKGRLSIMVNFMDELAKSDI